MTYLRPDSKSQVTIEYEDNGTPKRIEAIVVSTQHDDFGPDDESMLKTIERDVAEVLIPRVKASMSERVQALFAGDHKLHVNPTGKFVIVRWKGRTRRWCVQWQGPFQGGPVSGLCNATRGEEFGRCRNL